MHKPTRTFKTISLSILLLACMTTNLVLAIHPQRWEHTTEADFESGVTENVLITNLGDIKLAADTKLLDSIPELGSVIFDMHQTKDGTLYIASGPQSALLKKAGDKVELISEFKDEQVFAIDELPQGNLLLGISGTPSRLAYLDQGEIKTIIELPEARYIWDMIVRDNSVILATGIEGKLIRVTLNTPPKTPENTKDQAQDKNKEVITPPQTSKPPQTQPMQDDQVDPEESEPIEQAITEPLEPAVEVQNEKSESAKEENQTPQTQSVTPQNVEVPKTDMEVKEAVEPQALTFEPTVTVLYDSSQTNLLCLGEDQHGRIYVGTDSDGLIYRITEKPDGSIFAFVLYDAAEPEIGALLVLPNGTTYAGTADAKQARPGRLAKASNKQVGRPKVTQPTTPKTPVKPPHTPPAPAPVQTPKALETQKNSPEQSRVQPEKTVEQKEQAQATDTKPVETKVSQQQRDALREVVKNQLLAARDQGALIPMQSGEPVGLNRPAPKRASTGLSRRTPVRSKTKSSRGNAVYRITPQGFVSEIFRESVMILKLMAHENKLIVATGNEGQLFQVDPSAEETTIVAQLEPEQIPAMVHGINGQLYLGTANPAQIISLSNGYAKEGQFTSDVLDAQQISRWGNLQFVANLPEKSSLEIQTRSGNIQDPDKAPWSPWSESMVIEANKKHSSLLPHHRPITSPPARYLQYRITLKGDGSVTPTLDQIAANYAMPNLKPQVTALTAKYPGQKKRPAGKTGKPASPATFANAPNKEPQHHSKLQIEWKATDPNTDKLQYRLEYQIDGSGKWILLRHKVTKNRFEWDTVRAPDGWYLLRVIATDDLDNPKSSAKSDVRTSDPVMIDNSPPAFVGLKGEMKNSKLTLIGNVVDQHSNIRAVHYSVDAYNNWKPILPQDQIFDSTNEKLAFMISGLSTGRHVITLRVLDDRNNAAYQAVTIDMK